VYYWSDEFRPASIEGSQVPVRYDPFDIGLAYAFVKSRWVQCISEYYLQLKGHSERELVLATAELRKRLSNHSKEVSITAKRLAEFLSSAQSHEAVLMQRLRDAEAQSVFAQMGGYHGKHHEEPNPQSEGSLQSTPAEQEKQGKEETDVYAGLEIYEEYQ
jgi:putative transposase